MPTSEAVTRGIRVRVESRYLDDRSRPVVGEWLFAYEIEITNGGAEPVQLLTRHWVITNGEGGIEEVRGPGVVGQQPMLEPGQSFEYTSYCPLATPFGTMHGSYEMETMDGKRFDAQIAPFALSEPFGIN